VFAIRLYCPGAVADIPFNPLDKRNLGESVAGALLKQSLGPLPPKGKFLGAGIYTIYYIGAFKPYRRIAEQNRNDKFDQPIYVGKAVPPGARKGGFGLSTAPGPALFKRLNEHRNSIALTKLKIDDFSCRYLVSDDIWIPLGESLLIEWFQPLWNVLIDGFGNHPTGKRRATQYRSRWDTLHSGRTWAAKLPANPETPRQLQKTIADFFAGKDVPTISPEAAVTSEQQDDDDA
jgi:Eco29kI restriction endonuclease.